VSPIETLVCAALICIAAFTSASEVAIFSLSRFQLRSLKERARTSHRRIKALLADPGGLLITILVVNETVNIALSALIAKGISGTHVPFIGPDLVPQWVVETVLGILITTPLVLFLGEITPKVVGARANLLIASLSATPIHGIYEVAKPVRMLLRRYLSWLHRVTGAAGDLHSKDASLTESEFLQMVEEGHREGAIHEDELELIRNVFDLDDTQISEVMTPLSMVKSLVSNTTLKDALSAMRSQKYSRIPITSIDRRRVVGILYSKDLLRAKLEPELLTYPVSSIMRKPFVVAPTMRLAALFRKFKQQKTHMAIAQAPNGEALGVVTMSDVLEALFEDILELEEDHH
jgi:putative hemolysin